MNKLNWRAWKRNKEFFPGRRRQVGACLGSRSRAAPSPIAEARGPGELGKCARKATKPGSLHLSQGSNCQLSQGSTRFEAPVRPRRHLLLNMALLESNFEGMSYLLL